MKAIVYGEIIWDVYDDEAIIGGAPFNFAAHLAHLGDKAYLISAIGTDDLGEQATTHLKKHGVASSFVQKLPYPTGQCLVTLNEERIPSYSIIPNVAYDHIRGSSFLLDRINAVHADVFYFNTLIQRASESRETLRSILESCRFSDIFCDVNLRKDCFDKASLLLCLKYATIVKVSEEEAHFLFDCGVLENSTLSFPEAVAEAYPNIRLVVYTKGKDGSEVYDSTEKKLYVSGKPSKVPVVSTVGAGDCFGATFLHEYCAGSDIQAAIQKATDRADYVVSHREAVPF